MNWKCCCCFKEENGIDFGATVNTPFPQGWIKLEIHWTYREERKGATDKGEIKQYSSHGYYVCGEVCHNKLAGQLTDFLKD